MGWYVEIDILFAFASFYTYSRALSLSLFEIQWPLTISNKFLAGKDILLLKHNEYLGFWWKFENFV